MREELEVRNAEIQIPDTVRMEEAKIREMLKAGALSVDVAHAALEALADRQRRMAARDNAPAMNADTFEFGVQRCQDAVRNLGANVRKGEQASEARALVRELLGGFGTVLAATAGRALDSNLPDCSIWQNFPTNQAPIILVAGVGFEPTTFGL